MILKNSSTSLEPLRGPSAGKSLCRPTDSQSMSGLAPAMMLATSPRPKAAYMFCTWVILALLIGPSVAAPSHYGAAAARFQTVAENSRGQPCPPEGASPAVIGECKQTWNGRSRTPPHSSMQDLTQEQLRPLMLRMREELVRLIHLDDL